MKAVNELTSNDLIAIGLLAVAEEIAMLRDNQVREMNEMAPAYGDGEGSNMTDRLREALTQRGVI